LPPALTISHIIYITMDMKAIVISAYGPVENLVIRKVPLPVPSPGTARIRIRAFGVNHAEMHMRRGEWAESVPISGIECVGTIDDCPGGEFPIGSAVASVMGGLGRTISGSYAEYTVARVENIVLLAETVNESELPLPWDQLAALPESYCTAWTCLFRNLGLEKGHTLLIRGATSAFGRAALNLAVHAGATVVATSRNESKFNELKALGAADAVLEGPGLPARLSGEGKVAKFDRVLELVGNSTLLESLTLVRRHGRLCLAGWLGGLEPIKDFNPLLQMASGIHFSFFGSFVFGTPEFPLWDVPLQAIVTAVAEGKFDAKPWKVFRFSEIREAHRHMEEGLARGKMVVVVDAEAQGQDSTD